MIRAYLPSLVCGVWLAAQAASAADIRERTRLAPGSGAALTESQAQDLTLTVTPIAERQIQTWIRTGGEIDASRRIVTAYLDPLDAELVRPGQRTRAFCLESKSSMYQGRITRVVPQGDRVRVEVTLANAGHPEGTRYVLEIVVDRGVFLSIANEALIHEGDRRIVYVQRHPGHYEPQEVHTGLQGELYTPVLHGLEAGEQVVTLGSFFIDADYKLKASPDAAGNAAHEHQHH